ncbi:MAG: HDOD domain-containing protein [Magnetococcales bacterium]|nr:HDOD domain-containing protein [Magnetococcales bacterium]
MRVFLNDYERVARQQELKVGGMLMEVRESKRLKRAERLIENLVMPSRPDVLLEAMRTQTGFAPDLLAMTSVIRADMALSAAVLQAANTQLSGWKRKLISIEGSVALLGMEKVRSIVAEQFLSAALVGQDGPLQTVRLRGVETAQTAARLARELPQIAPHFLNGYLPSMAPDEAYAAGLLHDCGLVAMLRGFSDYAEFCQEMRTTRGYELVLAENERFGTNHCLTGFLMLKAWRLPALFCQSIRMHHQVDDFNRPGRKVLGRKYLVLRAILHLSASVCSAVERESQTVEEKIAAFLGMEPDRLKRLRDGEQ